MKLPCFAPLRALLCLAAAFVPVLSLSAQTNPPLQWRPLHEPGVGGWVTSLSFNPSNPAIVLAGGDILGVARSTDGGLSWNRPAAPAGSYMIEEFTWHPQAGSPGSPYHGHVWAGTMAGPWKSTDFGQTWVFKRTGMPQPNGGVQDFRPAIQKILVDPSNPARLLAFFGTHRLEKASGFFADSGKVYESLDGGENWASLATVVPGTDSKARLITTAAYQLTGPGGTTTLYAASRSGFFKSGDNGSSWTQKSTGLPAAGRNIRALAVHPADGRILWISVAGGGIFKSTDAGETWAPANTGLTSPASGTFDAIAVSPVNPSILFTSKIDDKKLYRSTDGGTTWVAQPGPALGAGPHPVYRDFRTLTAHPTQAGVFLGGTPTDIWKVTNATASDDLDGVAPYTGPFWSNVTSVPRNGGWAGTGFSGLVVNQFRWNPYNNNEAAMAAMDDGKFVSRDGLQSWLYTGGGKYKGINDWFAFRDFSFSAVSGHWYALQGQGGTNNALFRTINGGASWTTIAKPSVGGVAAGGDPGNVHVHRTDSNRLWVTWGGKLYYSPSAGATGTWTQLAADSAVYGGVSSLVADPADATGNTLWFGGSKGLFRTTDGTNFTQIAAGGTAQNISRVKLDPTNAARVWIVNANNANINTYDTGLWRLTLTAPGATAGTWSNLASWGNPASPVKYIVDVDVDPSNGNRIVVGTSQDNFTAITAETGVWVNDNNGASNAWRREINGLGVQRVRTVTFRPGTGELVAGTMGGGYYIADTDGSVIDLSPVSEPAVYDLAASADAEARLAGAGDGGGTVAAQTSAELHVGNANNGGSAYSPVYAFLLPDVGAVANPFTTATFTVGLSTATSTFGGNNVDVYGLTARTASIILAGDAYCGANDTTGATKLHDNWVNLNVSPAPATGLRTVSNAALVAYLNTQYASGAGAGKYVFIRLSPDSAGNSWKNIKFAASEYTANPAWRPRLVVE
jgi:hypothetical protein